MSGAAVSFEEFMRRALYDPEAGYYSRRIHAVGGRGDFTTVPVVSDALARAVAGWIAEARRTSGCRDVIEIGPGEGHLAAAVLRYLPWRARMGLRFHLVEVSEPLREIQQQRLGKRVRWHESPEQALRLCDGCALIYSNELVDAFPVRRFRLADDGWRETGVVMGPGAAAAEVLLPAGPLPDSSIFRISHVPGQVVEVHDSYRCWMDRWLPMWRSGRMLTIDYGNTAEKLLHRRPHGTVRGYLMRQRLEGMAVYQNMGRQDLTADVNFTDLMEWADGWAKTQSLGSLRGFCGIHAPAWMEEDHGAGEAFLVLDQQRGC